MSRKIKVCDITMKLADMDGGASLSFRQKIELAKLLRRLGVPVIETGEIRNGKRDSLLVKSLATAVGDSVLTVPVDIFRQESIDETWVALREARHPRLQVSVPVSTVQMEYQCHRKPAAIAALVKTAIARCRALCDEVEFIAEDFGRGEREFVMGMIQTAVESGATTVTIYDTAGTLFGQEFYESTLSVRHAIPESVSLGVWCSNEMYMADACALAAVMAGADEVKTTPYGGATASVKRFVKILSVKADVCHASCDVNRTELRRVVGQIKTLCEADRKSTFASMDGTCGYDGDLQLSANDDKDAVVKVTQGLGYDLSDDDAQRVYDAFLLLAQKSKTVGAKEIDAIVASVAFQAPARYHLESYLINSGNVISATCHMRLRKDGELLEGVCLGDGPVDAAFQAIEGLVGTKYELDDFQIQSVTGGRGAMGGATVRLRHEGKVISGIGTSTDIVEASILAYLNALNKIVYEEQEG